ncbi:MbnP family protein [Lewinella sp. W8]|uniref:MbnP family protein n=1 Tax=Lewinella sp. W8 TaxID=2528208 RepID=UPI0010689ED8|nr:MbnP family protein [Lewinella sp. W8]MTB53951.1 hypothetical protein [Lewinella sp. W8]
MHRSLLCLCLSLSLLLTSCYEDRIGCLDGDATNFDLRADQPCPDCCEYPELAVDVDHFFGAESFNFDSTYLDGAGNAFRVTRLRYYLSDLRLGTLSTTLDEPENLTELSLIDGADTVTAVVNADVALITASSGSARTLGRLRVGTEALTQVQCMIGVSDDLNQVFPPSASSSSPLSTQPGLLNFLDGQGYVQGRLEYILVNTSDTLSVSWFGNQTVTLPFGGELAPLRGFDLTLEMAADYAELLGRVNLSADSATVATALSARMPDLLTVTGVR